MRAVKAPRVPARFGKIRSAFGYAGWVASQLLSSGPMTTTRMRRNRLRLLLRITLLSLSAVLLPLLVALATLGLRVRETLHEPPVPEGSFTAPRTEFGTSRPIAVVLTGDGGAETSDFLIPFEVLATTRALDLYVLAPSARVVPLANAARRDGGLEILPHLSLAEYDHALGRSPDIIVVPYIPTFASGAESALVPWLRKQVEAGALVLSVCAGAEVVAATGLLDGHDATTHPGFIERLSMKHPQVRWREGVRYVESGSVISSGPIASGMDASLAAVRRVFGRDMAERVAAELGYAHRYFLDDPRHVFEPDLRLVATSAFSREQSVAVVLYDGVSELELGSVLDTYPITLGRRLVAVARERQPLRSKHGLWLLPRADASSAERIDAVLVPGIAPSEEALLLAEALRGDADSPLTLPHAGGRGFAYDGPLQDIARTDGAAVARAVARNLNYPDHHLSFQNTPLPRAVFAGPALAALGALLAAFSLGQRRGPRPGGDRRRGAPWARARRPATAR